MSLLRRGIIGAASILPRAVKNSLFHVGFHVAQQEFSIFSHLYAHAPNMELGMKQMRTLGFEPQTIVDVGAYQGNWSRMAASIWPRANLIMYEPNAAREQVVRSTSAELNATLHEELLGAEAGNNVQFYVMESGSSIMAERSPLDREVETRTLATLDSTLGDIKGPALLKIDAQGYELEILKGCSKHLPAISAILLEVAIIEINSGAPLLHEVVSFMDRIGFITYDIWEIHRRPLDRALNQVDLIFVRKDSPLIRDKRHFG